MDETERARISFDEREKQGRTYWLWRPVVEWLNQWNESGETPTFNVKAHLDAIVEMSHFSNDFTIVDIVTRAPSPETLVDDNWLQDLNNWYVSNIATKLWRN